MKVTRRQTDFNSVQLTIIATGKPGDDQGLSNVSFTPYNGPFTINWGDGSAPQVVAQPVDAVGPPATSHNDPTVVTHDYPGRGSAYRGYVEGGDARVRFHALASS